MPEISLELGVPQLVTGRNEIWHIGDYINAPTKPVGVYSTVARNLDTGSVVIQTDSSGMHPIYWHEQNGAISVRADLHENEPTPELNLIYLAARIACTGVLELQRGETPLRNVRSLGQGQTAHFTPGEAPQIGEAYYHRTHPDITLAEAAQGFKEAFRAAIVGRLALSKTCSSDGSGGYDSTTIALEAAANYEGEVFEAFIRTFPESQDPEDLQIARAIAASTPRLNLNEVVRSLPEFTDVGNIADEPGFATPNGIDAINRSIFREYYQAIRAVGSTLHFSGHGGDAILSPHRGHFVELARNPNDHFSNLCLAYAQLTHDDPRTIESSAIAATGRSLQDDLKSLADNLGGVEVDTPFTWFSHDPASGAHTLLTPAMQHALSERAYALSETIALPQGVGLVEYVSAQHLLHSANFHHGLRQVAERHGISIQSPFMDPAVVQPCLALGAAEKLDPYKFKNILRTAYDGALPDLLLNRNSKGEFSGSAHQGFVRNANNIRQLLTGSRLAEVGVIEESAVLRAVTLAEMGINKLMPALTNIIAIETWLQQRGY